MANHREQLKRFWKPDGVNVDPVNEAAIKVWMRLNALSLQPGSITTLLYSPMHRGARAAIVSALVTTVRRTSGGPK